METVADYFAKLASSSPTPGGGSAAMFVASTGAALLAMVCRITAQNAKSEEQQSVAERIALQADQLRETFLAARSLDETAFEAVVSAQHLPKGTEAERSTRSAALQAALQHASQVPLDSAGRALELLELTEQALEITNVGLSSDVGCAAEFAGSAIAACAYNVHINHKYMKDAAIIEVQRKRLTEIEQRAAGLVSNIRERLA